jgi:hypothetical protein
MTQAATTGLVPIVEVTEPKRSKRLVEEHFDPDAEWLVLMGDSAMGERGTLAGTIAQLEHGGPFTGVPNTDLYDDQQLGWGKTVVGLVEKHRWLSAARALLPEGAWADIVLRYTALPADARSDEGFGAKDRCPSVEDIEKLGAVETSRPTFFHIRRGTEAQLGGFAALAFKYCENAGKLLIACMDPNKGKHSRVIGAAVKKAKEVSAERHREWRAAMEQAKKPRKPSERRALLPEYDPAKADQ